MERFAKAYKHHHELSTFDAAIGNFLDCPRRLLQQVTLLYAAIHFLGGVPSRAVY